HGRDRHYDRPVHKHAYRSPDRRAYGRDWRRGRDTSINVVINSGFAGYPPPPRTVVVREYHAPAPVLVPTPVYAAPGPAPGYYGAGIGGGYRAATPNFGSAVGGALGGFVGAQVGEGSGQLAATAAGAVMGYLIGGQLGQPYR
ncbi:MAG: glycine zipper 2TM domain-containing protein, partial [Gammaproteobacteria bacterium]